MKNYYMIALLVWPFIFFGQNHMYLSNDTIDEQVLNGISYKGYHYFTIVKSVEALNYKTYKCYLYKFDNNLIIVDSIYFPPINSWKLYPTKTLVLHDTLVVLGTAIDSISNNSKVFFSRLSTNFSSVSHKLIETTNHHITFTDAIFNKNDKIIAAGMEGVDFMNSHPLILQCDKQGDIEIYSIDTTIKITKPILIELPEKNIYHVAGYSKIAIYDSALNLLNIFKPDLYNWFNFSFHLDNYNGANYFIGGNKSVLPEKERIAGAIEEDIDKDISYYLVNENAFPVDSGIIRNEVIRDYTGGLFYSTDNSLTIGGIFNYVIGEIPFFTEELNWLVVQSIDFNSKIENWYFEYGGDAYYFMEGLYRDEETKETIVYCNRYDWQNTTQLERDVFILKLDSTGLLVGQKEIDLSIESVSVYPNPGNDRLFVKGIKDRSEIALYDLYGRLVLSAVIEDETNSISTGVLKQGAYLYKVSDTESNYLYSGIWIKK